MTTEHTFHRLQHGVFDITVLSDGYISIPAETLVADATPAERNSILEQLSAHAGLVDVNTNIPLIRTGSDVVIVDIGAGANYTPTLREPEKPPCESVLPRF
jgi:hypothetical protein